VSLHAETLNRGFLVPDPESIKNKNRLDYSHNFKPYSFVVNAHKNFVGKPEGKKSLGRPRRRWEDNIKMDHREMGFEVVDWINLSQNRDRWRAVVNTVMNLPVA
jgi:hypothetical protein